MRELAELAGRIADLERRVFGLMRHGTVAAVDAGRGMVRLKLGQSTAGGDFLGPWVPYSQIAGAMKAHVPPAVGQQMTLMSPSGDIRQAVALPLTWSEQNESPSSSGEENVVVYGDVTIKLTADALRLDVGAVSLVVSAAGISVTGGRVEHDGKNIGSSHIHGGVERGPANTAPPAN
jgi:phage baseplate assembly protein V